MAKISKEEFKVLSDYIYKLTGIDLDESKDYLVETRLNPVLISYGLQSFSELYYKARSEKSGELEKKIVDAISTNETLFFRDNVPFDQLKYRIVPDLLDKKLKQGASSRINLDIWSAACSSGQEVYSIAISLLEVLEDIDKYEINILGTDISQQALANASYGKYNKMEIERGMPQSYLNKYFHPLADGWRINDYIRSMVKFQKLNLMDAFYGLGSFDIIFCRNVAIYFSQPDKRKLFQKLARVLKPEGYLIVGGSESLSGVAPEFESKHYLNGIYYQLKPAVDRSDNIRTQSGSRETGSMQGRKEPKPAEKQSRPQSQAKPKTGGEVNLRKNNTASGPERGSQQAAGEDKTDSSSRQSKQETQKEPSSSLPGNKVQTSAKSGQKSLLANLERHKGKENPISENKKEKSQKSLLEKIEEKKRKKSNE